MTHAELLSHCISEQDYQILSMQVTIPRIVLAEINTHRLFLPCFPFSMNAASSRAIPVKKMIDQVLNDPFVPDRFPKNGKGMQPGGFYDIDSREHAACVKAWLRARNNALDEVNTLRGIASIYDSDLDERYELNVHKEIANRLLEPWMYTTVIVTGTHREGEPGAWTNFEAQRCHPDAQRQIKEAAEMMRELRLASTPKLLKPGEWSTPYVSDEEVQEFLQDVRVDNMNGWLIPIKSTTARCARTSYKLLMPGQDVPQNPTIENEIDRYDGLETSKHFSPFEHAATPASPDQCYPYKPGDPIDLLPKWRGNLAGWVQIRKYLKGECR